MKILTTIYATAFLTFVFILEPSFTDAGRLGLHVTSEELAIWQTRRTSGPYRVSGDVSTNSPGSWTTILSNADLSNYATSRFLGYTGTGCVPAHSSSLGAVVHLGKYLRDGAFVYMITGTLSYRTKVVNELVAQVAEPGVNFGNTSKWCPQLNFSEGDNYFRTAMWVSTIIFAYDYLKIGDQLYGQSLPSGDKTAIETWITNAGIYFEAIAHLNATQVYPNRKSNDYTLSSQGTTACATNMKVPYFGEPNVKEFNGLYHSNRQLTYALVFTLVGVQQNNATLKTEAARRFKEYIRYNVFPNGYVGSFKRWETNDPSFGLVYGYTAYGLMSQIADVIARDGDASLYDYTTSEGLCGSAGGSKSLGWIMTEFAKYSDGTYTRYGTDQSGNNGNINYRIDTNDEISSGTMSGGHVFDHVLAQSNLYYQSSYVQSIYKRTASGTVSYPVNPWDGGYYEWGSSWGNLPSVMFMSAQLEGVVCPYPSTCFGSSPPLVPPRGLSVSRISAGGRTAASNRNQVQ